MTRGGTDRRRPHLYGDSPASQGFVPITSALFESCSRNPTLAARKRLASSIRGTAMRLPFGSTVESWLPRPSACPRPSPCAVPRVDGASRHHSQSSRAQLRASALREQHSVHRYPSA